MEICGRILRSYSGWSLFAACFALSGPLLPGTESKQVPNLSKVAGIAWDVRGQWRVDGDGAPLLTGDTIPPGSLLQPDSAPSAHSITILLPDGQRILYECFTAKDCARGFRVPKLESDPEPVAVRLVDRIHAVLVDQRTHPQLAVAARSPAGRDEAAVIIALDGRIEISGLAATLSDGRYVYDLIQIPSAYATRTAVPFQKSGRSIALKVPGPGLYGLRISDSLGNPRIDFMVAAVPQSEGNRIVSAFQNVHALLKNWIEEYQGWPVHDFQRLYLEALMLNIHPAATNIRTSRASAGPGPGRTAEPAFSPQPDVSAGDKAISLRCATPGATIHFTVDGAQPLDSSPVYHAPIVMKRIPITIKAFAESPGKKDSPVVTGIFRILNGGES
jgi:hypothetical protein